MSEALSQVTLANRHSLVSVDIFSMHHDQESLNQLEFDFNSIVHTSHSLVFYFVSSVSMHGVGEASRGGEAFWYCVDIADAFRYLLCRNKKSESFVWRNCAQFPTDAGVRWAQVRESMTELLRKVENVSTQSFACF